MAVISGETAFHNNFIRRADKVNVQPASVDVRLDRELLEYQEMHLSYELDPAKPVVGALLSHERIDSEPYLLQPGTFVLGSTFETIVLPDDVAATFSGKSSLARLGLSVHVTAGWIDPGFVGQITVEMSNVNRHPIMLRAGMRIGQIVFYEMDQPVSVPYGDSRNSYQNQRGPTPYRGYETYTDGLPNENH